LVNRAAVGYLLGHGFEMGAFMLLVMTDAPFGRFENYLFTSPPLFV
jgi:hypothetical protein